LIWCAPRLQGFFGTVSGKNGKYGKEQRRDMTLDQLKPGSECRIKRLLSRDKLGRRLLAMGIYPGLSMRVVRNAPLQDPMEVEINSVFLSLRRTEARFIEVDPA
jgi:ferrous iron transport protein A